MNAVCAVCDEPLTDAAVLCHGCSRRLALTLRDVPELARELDVTITKRANVAHRPGPRSAAPELDPVSLEFDQRAAEVLHSLTAVLQSWASNLAEDMRLRVTAAPFDPGWCARWLAAHMSVIRTRDWAPDLHAEVMDAVRAATRAIDAPPELAFKGYCPSPAAGSDGSAGDTCRAELWGKPGAAEGWCRACGAEVDYAAVAAGYVALAADLTAPATVIARALTAQGKSLERMRIYRWKSRGLIAPVGTDRATGQALYRLGDVADVLARMEGKTVKKGIS